MVQSWHIHREIKFPHLLLLLRHSSLYVLRKKTTKCMYYIHIHTMHIVVEKQTPSLINAIIISTKRFLSRERAQGTWPFLQSRNMFFPDPYTHSYKRLRIRLCLFHASVSLIGHPRVSDEKRLWNSSEARHGGNQFSELCMCRLSLWPYYDCPEILLKRDPLRFLSAINANSLYLYIFMKMYYWIC